MSYFNVGVGQPRFPYKTFFTYLGDGQNAPENYAYGDKTKDLFTIRTFRDSSENSFVDLSAMGHGTSTAQSTYRWFLNYATNNASPVLTLTATENPISSENVTLDLKGKLKSTIIYAQDIRDYANYETSGGKIRFDDRRLLMNFGDYVYIGPLDDPTTDYTAYKLAVDGDCIVSNLNVTGNFTVAGALRADAFDSVSFSSSDYNGGVEIGSTSVRLRSAGSDQITMSSSSVQIDNSNFIINAPLGNDATFTMYSNNESVGSYMTLSRNSDAFHHFLNHDGTISWLGQNGNSSFTRGYLSKDGEMHAWSFHTLSDRRLKEDILSLSESESLDIIKSIDPVKYTLISSGKKKLGFIAQDVMKVCPMMVAIGTGSFEVNRSCEVEKEGERKCIEVESLGDIKGHVIGNGMNIGEEGTHVEITQEGKKLYFKSEEESLDNVKVKSIEVKDVHSIEYTNLIAVLVSAVQSLTSQVETLSSRIAVLEER